MRVANVDLTDLNQNCSDEFNTVNGPSRYCRRTQQNHGCNSQNFPTWRIPFSRVCGRATGLQIGGTDGFFDQNPNRPIDDVYVDGVSLTYRYGTDARNHIWTFVAS